VYHALNEKITNGEVSAMRAFWPLLGMTLWATALHAQAEEMNLRQCVALALSQNPSLMASAARIEQAQAAINKAQNTYFPKVTTSIAATRSNDPLNVFGMKLMQQSVVQDDFIVQKLNNPGDYSNVTTRIQAEMPLYTGGQIDAYVRQAKAYLDAAQSGDMAARQQLIFMVFQAFDGVDTANAFVEVAEQGVKAAESFVKTAENLTAQGVLVKSELLTAKVHLANVQVQLEQAQNQRSVAEEQLKLLMGMPLDADLRLIKGAGLAQPALDVAQAKEKALAVNPQLRALRMQAESSSAAVDAAKSAYLPNVGLVARQDWNDTNVALNHSSYTIAGVMNWTLTDFGVTRATVDQARATQSELLAKVRQQEQDLNFKVSEAYKKAREAANRVTSLEVNVQQADEAERLVRQRHEGGVATITEVLVAETQLLKAKADLVSARHDVNTQRGMLRMLLGDLDESSF
jgi:outer membrane protein TolC